MSESAAGAAAELQRLRAEEELRAREEKLARLIESALDAIVELDRSLRVRLVNPAGAALFQRPAGELVGVPFTELLAEGGARTLERLVAELAALPVDRRRLWVPAGLSGRAASGAVFPADATIARFDAGGEPHYTVILHDVSHRMEAERHIRALSAEAAYLREEVRALRGSEEILGESEALQRALAAARQVAATDASVLLLGETGTGKQLLARAIHRESARRDRPLVEVNCAAIPAGLIESELFGHVRGAFTGATRKREGRFSLASGGTILLDEVGELPLELQSKLLRVLHEGLLEPVGSSRSRRVDVRVIAATNRDLLRAVREGAFRADLYYRLSVFPIEMPPLRARGDDVLVLAAAFAQRFAQRLRRPAATLSAQDVRRLRAYPWPGNVRELANVIERAVITSPPDRLELAGLLPDPPVEAGTPESPADAPPAAPPERVMTAAELHDLERANLERALLVAGGRVAGPGGAARLVGVPPSTFTSRMKALGVHRRAEPA